MLELAAQRNHHSCNEMGHSHSHKKGSWYTETHLDNKGTQKYQYNTVAMFHQHQVRESGRLAIPITVV